MIEPQAVVLLLDDQRILGRVHRSQSGRAPRGAPRRAPAADAGPG